MPRQPAGACDVNLMNALWLIMRLSDVVFSYCPSKRNAPIQLEGI
jgi:hypothetical protein